MNEDLYKYFLHLRRLEDPPSQVLERFSQNPQAELKRVWWKIDDGLRRRAEELRKIGRNPNVEPDLNFNNYPEIRIVYFRPLIPAGLILVGCLSSLILKDVAPLLASLLLAGLYLMGYAPPQYDRKTNTLYLGLNTMYALRQFALGYFCERIGVENLSQLGDKEIRSVLSVYSRVVPPSYEIDDLWIPYFDYGIKN